VEGIAEGVGGTVEAALDHNTADAAAVYCQWPTRTVAVDVPTSSPKSSPKHEQTHTALGRPTTVRRSYILQLLFSSIRPTLS